MQFCKIYASTECIAEEGNSQASFMDQKLHTKKVFEISFPDEIYQFCSLEVLAQVDMTPRVHTLKKSLDRNISRVFETPQKKDSERCMFIV